MIIKNVAMHALPVKVFINGVEQTLTLMSRNKIQVDDNTDQNFPEGIVILEAPKTADDYKASTEVVPQQVPNPAPPESTGAEATSGKSSRSRTSSSN